MPNISTFINRIRPSAVADGNYSPARGGRYGEQFVVPITSGTYPLSDEGSYFKVTNPTPGTGIPATIQTSFAATNCLFHIRNNDTAGGKRLYMDYITLICTVVPASATSVQLVATIDNPATTRYSSGGSALTPVNINMDSSATASGVVHFGAVTLAAASAGVRLIGRGVLRSSIPVIQDTILLNFGHVDTTSMTMGGATALGTADQIGPVIIGPQQDFNIHVYYPGNATTAASWEMEAGWWER